VMGRTADQGRRIARSMRGPGPGPRGPGLSGVSGRSGMSGRSGGGRGVAWSEGRSNEVVAWATDRQGAGLRAVRAGPCGAVQCSAVQCSAVRGSAGAVRGSAGSGGWAVRCGAVHARYWHSQWVHAGALPARQSSLHVTLAFLWQCRGDFGIAAAMSLSLSLSL
jgi:hypothetical protein